MTGAGYTFRRNCQALFAENGENQFSQKMTESLFAENHFSQYAKLTRTYELTNQRHVLQIGQHIDCYTFSNETYSENL